MPGTDITYTTGDDENFGGYLAAPDGDEKAPGMTRQKISGTETTNPSAAHASACAFISSSTPNIAVMRRI